MMVSQGLMESDVREPYFPECDVTTLGDVTYVTPLAVHS
jgi:hypothetical protein